MTHSIWRGESAVVAIDLEAELVVRIDDTGFGGGGRPGASVVLDVAHGLILATCSDPATPEFLALGRVAGGGLTPDAVDVRWEAITPRKAVVDAVWERRTLGGQPDDEFEITACLSNAPYAGGSHGTQHPAVLYPHGGPHSAYAGPGVCLRCNGAGAVGLFSSSSRLPVTPLPFTHIAQGGGWLFPGGRPLACPRLRHLPHQLPRINWLWAGQARLACRPLRVPRALESATSG